MAIIVKRTHSRPICHIAASLLIVFPTFSVAGILVGVPVLPVVASSNPRPQISSPSRQAQRSATQHATSTPQKKAVSVIQYRNTQYGFCFSLPEGWKGYSIVVEEWVGSTHTQGPHGDVNIARGPIISIRHPRWTAEDPRQDIPIMVFTRAQWRSLKEETFFVSAAPIGPDELGRNSKYIFALPPRFGRRFR